MAHVMILVEGRGLGSRVGDFRFRVWKGSGWFGGRGFPVCFSAWEHRNGYGGVTGFRF